MPAARGSTTRTVATFTQRKQSQLDCRRHKQAWHDRGKRSVLRHVFRIFLIMTIRLMVRIPPSC